jgi:hypothetical protein
MSNCIKRKDLILFYYKELKTPYLKKIESHLKECKNCQKEYKEIDNFLIQLHFKLPEIRKEDIESILDNLKDRLKKENFWVSLKENIRDFFHNLSISLSYRTQLVPVLVALLIIILGIIPWIERYNLYYKDKDFEILQIEAELSVENGESSIFDLYEDEWIMGSIHFLNS